MKMRKLAVGAVGAGLLLAGFAGEAFAGVVYSNIPTTLAGNYPSQPYQAQQTSEFGDRITLGGADRGLNSITLTLSSWADAAYYGYGSATSFNQDLTLNVYDAGSGLNHGALLGTVTQNFAILFRPTVWNNPTTGAPYGGIAQNVTFDFSSLNLMLPNSIVVGLAFNTQSYGVSPTGVEGPYNSLNFALNTASGGGITVGSNNDLDDVMWNTLTAGWYADGGAGGVGTFRQDTAWTGYAPMIEVNTVPLPSAAYMGVGMLGLLALGRRFRTKRQIQS